MTAVCQTKVIQELCKILDKILAFTMKLGTFIVIPEVCLRIFPNFSSTEAAFEWCSTKVVVL